MIRYKRWMGLFLVFALFFGGCGSEEIFENGIAGAERGTEAAFEDGEDSESESERMESAETEYQTNTQTQESEETTPEPDRCTVTVTAVGDCTLGATQNHSYAGSFHEYYDRYGADYFFDGVKDFFFNDDFTLVNLECVLTESNARVDKEFNLKGKPEYVGIMTGSSVEGCSLGNNHTQDYGPQSLADTRQVLEDAGLVYGYNDHVDRFVTGTGIVIGIVSTSLLSSDPARANFLREGIEELRAQGADLVIASCHWGVEREHYANDYQRRMAHQVVDWGADLVIGTHPHVLQGVEIYKDKVICYSLGNFCFGGNKNPSDKDTAIFQQKFTFVDGVLQTDVNADIIPCTISSASGCNDFQPTVCKEEQKDAIIRKINEYSEGYSEFCFDENGKLILKNN